MLPHRRINPEAIYSSFRAENKKPLMVILNIWRYMLKYFFKKRRYSEEELQWAEMAKKQCNQLLVITNEVIREKEGQILKLGFAGDIMWVRKEGESMIASELKERMEHCDFWIGNLETPIVPENKVRTFWPDYIRYGSSGKILRAFRNRHGRNMLGIVSLANNHILDNGSGGLETTLSALTDEGIKFSGIDNEFCVKELKGIKIGFYAMTYDTNRPPDSSGHKINILNYSSQCLNNISSVFRRMDDGGVDLKILSLHWGHEFEFIPSAEQRELAGKIVAEGADIILGHHPHVIQPIEIIYSGGYEGNLSFPVNADSFMETSSGRKALVLYSAGNFITDMVTREVREGIGVILELFKSSGGIEWQIKEIIHVQNKPSGIFSTHETYLSEDKLSSGREKVSH
jgi:poly-gamma-glutamate capsule biosynthesis protein CapA/YwtB (metallophosphatase superfamily)